MYTENNHESKRLKIRIATGSALVVVGVMLVGAALNSMLQSEPWPCWAILLLGIGSITLIAGLLILIMPGTAWRRIWYTILGFPRWLKETFVWILYKPKYIIDEPTFSRKVLEIDVAGYEGHYIAKTRIHIEAKRKPVKINLSYVKVFLKQRTGWEQREVQLILETHKGIPEISLEPGEKRDLEVEVDTVYGVHKRESLPDTQKEYRCGIWRIQVDLPGGIRKYPHKGIYCKPERQHHIGIL